MKRITSITWITIFLSMTTLLFPQFASAVKICKTGFCSTNPTPPPGPGPGPSPGGGTPTTNVASCVDIGIINAHNLIQNPSLLVGISAQQKIQIVQSLVTSITHTLQQLNTITSSSTIFTNISPQITTLVSSTQSFLQTLTTAISTGQYQDYYLTALSNIEQKINQTYSSLISGMQTQVTQNINLLLNNYLQMSSNPQVMQTTLNGYITSMNQIISQQQSSTNVMYVFNQINQINHLVNSAITCTKIVQGGT